MGNAKLVQIIRSQKEIKKNVSHRGVLCNKNRPLLEIVKIVICLLGRLLMVRTVSLVAVTTDRFC